MCWAGRASEAAVKSLVSEKQYNVLLAYLDLVLEYNQHTNLTGMPT